MLALKSADALVGVVQPIQPLLLPALDAPNLPCQVPLASPAWSSANAPISYLLVVIVKLRMFFLLGYDIPFHEFRKLHIATSGVGNEVRDKPSQPLQHWRRCEGDGTAAAGDDWVV